MLLRETPKFGKCRLSPVNVNIYIVSWNMPEIFAKYPYFLLTPVNVDIRHALMVNNVEHVGYFDFLLRNSVAIKRHKGDITFSPLFPRGLTKNFKTHSTFKKRKENNRNKKLT